MVTNEIKIACRFYRQAILLRDSSTQPQAALVGMTLYSEQAGEKKEAGSENESAFCKQ